MRIFLTGATGYLGTAVRQALEARGHHVSAFQRGDSLATLGDFDAYVHTAFSMTDPVGFDRSIVDAFTAKGGFVLYTSGVWVLGNTDERGADESSEVNPLPLVAWRPAHEQRVLASGRNAVIRPGCVYGGKQSMLAGWFAAADQGKPIEVAGDGENHWALVDLHDLADCYARIVEQRAPGIFHAIDDTTATMNECARAVAPNGEIKHVTVEGFMAPALLVDQHVSSVKTRDQLAWQPKREFVTSVDEQWAEWRSAQKRNQ